MKKIVKFLSVLLLLQACNGEQFASVDIVDYDDGNGGQEMILLGERLEDTYSVENMSQALSAVYGTKADRVVLTATDYYVRFLPESEEEYDMLEAMGLVMLDHPVDYEIVKEGDWYHDPAIPDEEITWQYAVVDKDFQFPAGIRYEKLEDCYISDNDKGTKADWVDWMAVEAEAFRLTGNGGLLAPATKAGGNVPHGRITISDDRTREVSGVKGVTVCCNSFVKIATAFTDEEGNYQMSKSFASEVRYRLEFKNKFGFGIGFNLVLVPASLSALGKHSSDGYDYHIDRTSERKLFCRSVVNNAGYDYFKDCEEKGMECPPKDLRIWLFQGMKRSSAPMLQQGAFVDGSILANYLGTYLSLLKMFLPDITLGMEDQDDFASIYGTAIHEFAHASHFMQVGKTFWNSYIRNVLLSFITSGFATYGAGTEEGHGYCEIAEMWAYYVQTMFFREKYQDETAVFGTSFWFRPQILVTLDERGLTRQKIFNAYTPDICDKDALQTKLVSLYPEMKNTINQTFGRYD